MGRAGPAAPLATPCCATTSGGIPVLAVLLWRVECKLAKSGVGLDVRGWSLQVVCQDAMMRIARHAT